MGIDLFVYGFSILVVGLMIFGVSLFVEWLVIKHVMDNPANGLLASVFGAFMVFFLGSLITGNLGSTGVIALVGGLLLALAFSMPSYFKRKKNFVQQQTDEMPS
jgi:thiol:disulfide interchange protein